MATFPLVGQRDDLAALVKTSLQHHDIPVTAAFEVLEPPYDNRFFAIVTPLVETKGLRQAYMSVFSALDAETFAAKDLLRLNTLVLSADELRDIRQHLKKGMSETSLPKLAHLRDVIVRPIEDAKDIQKNGMLHFVLNQDGSLMLTFGDFGKAGGAMKPRYLQNLDRLRSVLSALRVRSDLANEAAPELQKFRHASIPITSSLEALYTQGLI